MIIYDCMGRELSLLWEIELVSKLKDSGIYKESEDYLQLNTDTEYVIRKCVYQNNFHVTVSSYG
jgi:hypothetical protein